MADERIPKLALDRCAAARTARRWRGLGLGLGRVRLLRAGPLFECREVAAPCASVCGEMWDDPPKITAATEPGDAAPLRDGAGWSREVNCAR